jgi:exodeoxyribonuclease-5
MSLFSEILYKKLKLHLGHVPTPKQDTLLQMLAQFVQIKQDRSLFMLKGYAGTGKTTLISALIKSLREDRVPFRLMAPTGRAAKVLGQYSGYQASTIHRSIYFARTGSGGGLVLTLQKNKLSNAVFIVDEASMIPADTSSEKSGGRNLLYDLMEYVFSGNNCKLILVGDTAQLPPVGIEISPALDKQYMHSAFHLNITAYQLTEVVRQERESGILDNATRLREKISHNQANTPFFDLYGFKDIVNLPGMELLEELQSSYDFQGFENTAIITRSNKRANQYNREIRNRILFREEEISAGDLLMVVKNNYFWLEEDSKAGFLANGDMVEVMKVIHREQMYGFDFADVMVRLVDYPDEEEKEVKIMLDALFVDRPALSYEDNNRLFNEIMLDYEDIPQRRKKIEAIKKNPYFNALQVKFAYALTCHKTQGGQWEQVFIDQGFIKEEMLDREYMRWLYTAITRATKKVFLINFPESFVEEV